MNKEHEIYIKAAKSAKIGIWQVDLADNTIYWDVVVRQILEVDDDYIPVFGDGLRFYSEGKSRDSIQKYLDCALNQGISFNDKFEIQTEKNNIKHVECVCEIEFVNGLASRLLGTFQDITNEQNLIKELENSVEKFSSVFTSANDAIVIIDSETGFIGDCNNRFHELTRFNKAELLEMHYADLFPFDKKKEVRVFYKNQLRKDEYSITETCIIDKQNQRIPIEIASEKKFKVLSKTYLVCFFRDISERKKANENITMLSLVAEETTDAIVITDPNGEVLWINKAFSKLTGYSLMELEGRKPGQMLTGPKTNSEKTNLIRNAIKNRENIKVSLLNYNKQRQEYWFELNITPIFDSSGECMKFVGVGRDITERKERELEMKSLLEFTNQQNNKLYNFTHIVSHNIRSHTSNLSMILDVMEHTDDVAEKLSYTDYLKDSTVKLTETIEYLNDIITIQRNVNIERTGINIKKEIEKIKKSLSQTILESGIHITDVIPTDLVINAIPAYLDSILLNLMTNAIKYQSRDRQPKLEIGYEIRETYTILTFTDNGLGINMEKYGHKIFGMYKTFHGNDDARGIGLFMSKNQIEAMNGKICVESEEGVGSTFKIYFTE